MKSSSVSSRLAVLATVLAITLSVFGATGTALADGGAQLTPATVPSEPTTSILASSEDENGPYGLWVGETKVTDDALSGKGWKFDKNSNTLSLEEFENLKTDGTEEINCWHEGAAIYYAGERELTIEAKGYNTAYGPFADESDKYEAEIEDGYGILNDGKGDVKIVVKDGGSFEIIGGKASLKGSLKVDKGLYVDAGPSINEYKVVKGFDPTTEVKAYKDESSKYVYIAPKALHRVVVADSDNGFVMASPSISEEGEQVELGIFPGMSKDGKMSGYEYELDTLSVTDESGKAIAVTDVDATSKTFTMPNSDVSVMATFKRKQYSVTVAPTTHGTVTVDKAKAIKGEKVTLTITPDDGYVAGQPTFTALGVEDVPILDNAFEMPGADVTVYVTFEKDSADTGTSSENKTPSSTTNEGTAPSGNSSGSANSSGNSSGSANSSGSVAGSTTSKLASTSDPTSLTMLVSIALCGVGAGMIGIRSRKHE